MFSRERRPAHRDHHAEAREPRRGRPASATPGNTRPRWPDLALALVLILGAALVAGVYVLLPEKDDGPDYPAAWNPRVQKYVDIVEDERGLEFKHPIHVDFLSVKDFRRKVTVDGEDLTDKDREEIKQYDPDCCEPRGSSKASSTSSTP